MSPVTLLGLQHSALFAVGLFAHGRSWPNDVKCRQNDGVPRARAHRYLVRRARPELAQSARASLHDRMSALASAAGEIAHSMAVDRVAIDRQKTTDDACGGRSR